MKIQILFGVIVIASASCLFCNVMSSAQSSKNVENKVEIESFTRKDAIYGYAPQAYIFKNNNKNKFYIGTSFINKDLKDIYKSLNEDLYSHKFVWSSENYEIYLPEENVNYPLVVDLGIKNVSLKKNNILCLSKPLSSEESEVVRKYILESKKDVENSFSMKRIDSKASSDCSVFYNFDDLTASASVIAIGRVVGVVRQGHTPINSTHVNQHTVFAFAVEQYLKTEDQPSTPIIKIWNEGGNLAWSTLGFTGVGYAISEQPMLMPGYRYIVCLRKIESTSEQRKGRYIAMTSMGVTGPVMALDEYPLVHSWQASILLKGGVSMSSTVVSPLPNDEISNWKFIDGSSILGLTEEQIKQMFIDKIKAQASEVLKIDPH